MAAEAITGIGAVSGTNLVDALYRQGAEAMTGSGGATDGMHGADFAAALNGGLSQLASMEQTTTTLAAQAATGDLSNIHDYVVAASSMQTATELTTTIRNKALDAFNEIMRMQL